MKSLAFLCARTVGTTSGRKRRAVHTAETTRPSLTWTFGGSASAKSSGAISNKWSWTFFTGGVVIFTSSLLHVVLAGVRPRGGSSELARAGSVEI